MARKFHKGKPRKHNHNKKRVPNGRPPREMKASKGYMLAEGKVAEAYPNSTFGVDVTMASSNSRDGEGKTHRVLCYVGGAMRNIFVTVGDMVRIEVSLYDLEKGRIVWRLSTKAPEAKKTSRRSRRGD